MNAVEQTFERRQLRRADRLKPVPAGTAEHEARTARGAGASGPSPSPDGGVRLAGQMQARMAQQFGQPVIQMRRPGEEAPGPAGSAESMIASLEQRSGVDLSDVQVHRNSPRPAAIGALAYAQGTQVYLGPGQERHLGHELTHVVQQKQGMVRATGSVDGMPVNTAPALERAADAMQVSAGPEAAAPGPGVVQGVFVNPSGKRHNDQDVAGMQRMLEGSLDSMIAEAQAKGLKKGEAKRVVGSLQKARRQLGKRLAKAQKSGTEFSAAEMMTSVINDAVAGMKLSKKDSANMQLMLCSAMGNGTAYQTYFGGELVARDTGEGVQQSMAGFRLPQVAAEGIEEIGEYDPTDAMDELTEGRMGNSASLAASLATTPEAQAKRQQSMQQFQDGAAVARQGAAAMKEDPDSISFSSLMDLFSGINTQVRGGADDAGKLRGKKVTVGQLAPPGASALPEDAYRTFSFIADQMKQIKANPDKKLAKTQAAHLAAFAYQMTISEHMFADGNGRTCRLFADSILQSFGLPPSTPVEELSHVGANMGESMDFQAGADAILAGVRKSDQALKESRPGMAPAPAEETPVPRPAGEKTSEQRMSYRSGAIGALAAEPVLDFDPASTDPQDIDVSMRRMYEKIKNPPAGEDPEVTRMRRQEFARMRAAQIDAETRRSAPAAPSRPEAPRKKKGFFSRLFSRA